MPSGAKKRKAARRKEEREMEQGVARPPNTPTNHSPDNGHEGKDKTSRSSSSSSSSSDEEKQEEREEPAVTCEMDETARAVDDDKAEVEVPVSTEAGVVSAEFVQDEKSEVGAEESAAAAAAATVASVVPIDAPADEKAVEAAEAAAETLETSLEIDSLSHETEVKTAPILGETPADSVEISRGTEIAEPTPGPWAEHRASWWNCCGLFDFLTGSKENIRA